MPPEYSNFFVTMATVAATLFGLIFLVVSITPDAAAAEEAQLERQLKALAAYVALSNPLIISLFAILPHQEIGPAVTAVAGAGLANILTMTVRLLRDPAQRRRGIRSWLFILVGLGLYGFEMSNGLQLLRPPASNAALYALGTVLIFIIVFGVARAWELVGGRRYRI